MSDKTGEWPGFLVLLFVACGLTAGCDRLPTQGGDGPPAKSPDDASQPSTSAAIPSSATPVPVREVDTLLLTSTSGITASRRQVIRDADELEAAWRAATGPLLPETPAPDVDFGADLVLLVAMGERPSGGHSIDLSALAEADDTLYATVEETEPGASCVPTAVLTQPVLMIRAPGVGTDVVFIEAKSVLDCS